MHSYFSRGIGGKGGYRERKKERDRTNKKSLMYQMVIDVTEKNSAD